MEKAKGIVWKLNDLYAKDDDPKIHQDIDEAIEAGKEFKKRFHGKIASEDCTEDRLVQALQSFESIIEGIYRPYAMANLLFAADGRSDKYKALVAKVQDAHTRIENSVLFFALEIQKIPDDKMSEIYASGKLGHYRHYVESLRLFTPYTLDEKSEQIINNKNLSGKTAFVNLFDEFTAEFEWELEIDGEKKKLTASEVRQLLWNQDADLRKRAKIAHDAKFGENGLIFTNVFGNLIKDHSIEMEMRGYESPIQPSYLSNKVSKDVVETMMDVTTQNYHLARQYYRLKAKLLGMPKLKGSDLYAPITKSERVIPFEEGEALVLDSFRGFSPEFGDIIEKAFSDDWIDAEIRPGKRGGAFCMSVTPEFHPYVLMNYVDNLNSVYTMAHELGHALHTVLSSEKQTALTFHPPLVLAETASVFAEMLLTRRLRSEDLDRETHIQILASKLEDFFATISRQTMYIQFELAAHQEGAKRRLSADDFCTLWTKHRDEMYSDVIDFFPEEKWYWAVIPHFIHTRFYCYAYTFGALFVLALYNRYEQEGEAFVPKYRELLAAGDSTWPQTLVESVGMDFLEARFWQGGFTVIENMLDELQELAG
ncbi:M3 family oligoendopeptidase [candidate division KSB1 bacterium]|nr:M3 family oligoendopeptidase [candidate division KSB1 bacterium]NIR70994.1 M3 family oligoendopeptidase [candidate division KSB1 bacterium]NIS24735.1 M3 family oligoendopeptidase [candidate division KSB1 bacterium]NIT71639.1 M3 family oligoendopeptidase [candidate division KSB1 bacterium]NIU25346.1 M3 family oligoendopeptidase [candidate division KSB1 bacterium]